MAGDEKTPTHAIFIIVETSTSRATRPYLSLTNMRSGRVGGWADFNIASTQLKRTAPAVGLPESKDKQLSSRSSRPTTFFRRYLAAGSSFDAANVTLLTGTFVAEHCAKLYCNSTFTVFVGF